VPQQVTIILPLPRKCQLVAALIRVQREGVAVGAFVLKRPCIETTVNGVMRQSIYVARRGYELRNHFRKWQGTMFLVPFLPHIHPTLYTMCLSNV